MECTVSDCLESVVVRTVYDRNVDISDCEGGVHFESLGGEVVSIFVEGPDRPKGHCFTRTGLRKHFESHWYEDEGGERVYNLPSPFMFISGKVAHFILHSRTKNITITQDYRECSIVPRNAKEPIVARVHGQHILGKTNRCYRFCSDHIKEWVFGLLSFLTDVNNTTQLGGEIFDLSFQNTVFLRISDVIHPDEDHDNVTTYMIQKTPKDTVIFDMSPGSIKHIGVEDMKKAVMGRVWDHTVNTSVSMFFKPVDSADEGPSVHRINNLDFRRSAPGRRGLYVYDMVVKMAGCAKGHRDHQGRGM